MQFLQPITVTDGMLLYSNLPESEYPPLGGSGEGDPTYNKGFRVHANHRVYEALRDGISSWTWPLSPLDWLDVGSTNLWAMFDLVATTVTRSTGLTAIEVQLAVGPINDIILLGCVGVIVRVQLPDVLREVEIPIPVAPSTSSTVMIGNLGSAGGTLRLIIENYGDAAQVAGLSLGRLVDLGDTQRGTSIGLIDYSVKKTDSFGVTSVARRGYSRRVQARVVVATADVDRVAAILADVRATPCVWIVVQGYACLALLGYYRDWSLDISGPVRSSYSITLESLAEDAITLLPGQALLPGYTRAPVLSHLRFNSLPPVDEIPQNQVVTLQGGTVVPYTQTQIFSATGAGQSGVSGSGGAMFMGAATYSNRVYVTGTSYGQTQYPVFTLNEVGLTFEAFFYVSSTADNFYPWVSYGAKDPVSGRGTYTQLELHFHAGVVDIYVSDSTNIGYSGTVTAPTISNGWTHIAVVASAVGTNVYVSGVKVMSGNYAVDTAAPPTFIGYEVDQYDIIGNPFKSRLPLVGEVWIDEVRLTNGVVYSGDSFTPPSGPLPAYVNTYVPRALTTLPANTTLADLNFSAYPPTDATGRSTPVSSVALSGASPLSIGRAGGAVSLVGDQLVSLDSTPTDLTHVQRIGTNSVTIEFVMKVSSSTASELTSGTTLAGAFIQAPFVNPDLVSRTGLALRVLFHGPTKTIQVSIQADMRGRNITDSAPSAGTMLPVDFVAADSWVQCAAVVTGNTISLYMRGLLVANRLVLSSGSAVTVMPETLEMRGLEISGASPAADRSGWLVDELKVTNSAMYSGTQYVPIASTANADVFDTPGRPYKTVAYFGFDTVPMYEIISRTDVKTFVAGTTLTPVDPKVFGRAGHALDLYDLRASGNGVYANDPHYPVAATLDGYVVEADLRQVTPEANFNIRGYWDSNIVDDFSTYMFLTLYTSYNAGTRYLSAGIYVNDGSTGRFTAIDAFFGLPPGLILNQWSRCAVQLTGNQLKLFLNGALVGSQTLAYNVGSLRLPYVRTYIYGTAPGAIAGQNLIDNVRVAHGVLYT